MIVMGRSAVTSLEAMTKRNQDDNSPALVVDSVGKQFGSGDSAVTAVDDVSSVLNVVQLLDYLDQMEQENDTN
jgi:hypothetical protein